MATLAAGSPSRREVVRRLAHAQKSNRGAGGYSRWVNRPVGRHLAALSYLCGLKPNQVSAISAFFTLGALTSVALLRPTWLAAVLIALALLIGYAFDSADGQVARLRGGGSPAGEWLDHVLDAVKACAFHLAIAIVWFRYFDLPHPALLLVPLGFAVTSSVFFFAMILSDMLRRIDRARSGETSVTTSSVNPAEAAPVLRSLVVLPNDYGVVCLSLLLLPLHRSFVVAYTLLLAANLVVLAVGCVRWFAEMSGLGRAPDRAAAEALETSRR